MLARVGSGTRRRRLLIALSIHLVCTGVYFACAAPNVVGHHTIANHHALLADAWLRGRLDLGHPPPDYTQNNDFASWKGRWYVSFPPLPAVLLLPFARAAGAPERLRDGQIWLWLAGLGPAMLFLALEKLRRAGYSHRSERTNVLLAGLFAFGTVYFFTALQGDVWFAAHVVSVPLVALYLIFAIDAERPVLAGLCLVLAFATRGPPIALGAALFCLEALRRSCRAPLPSSSGWSERAVALWRTVDGRALIRRLALFAAPIAAVMSVIMWHNQARFGSPWEFGHHLLVIGWRPRIDRWGLFSYHYLARNLGVMLTSLPYLTQVPARVQINTHGLALWVTTPIYLWLLWPRRTGWLWANLAVAVGLVAGTDLLYQNSGSWQFGYRFSNDYAVYLFAMLAIGGFRFRRLFWTCAALGVAVNTFGALTFHRACCHSLYYDDPSQRTLYQPD
jgi:hypothetical protein